MIKIIRRPLIQIDDAIANDSIDPLREPGLSCVEVIDFAIDLTQR